MLVSHIDAANHVVALPDHPNLFRLLDEIHWLGRGQQLPGNATRIAYRLRREGKPPLSRQHLFVRLLHLFRRPRLENRVLDVADVRRHLAWAVQIAVEWISWILPDRAAAQSRRRIEPMDA